MAIDPSAVWDFAKEVVGAARTDRGRTLATVTRIDADGTTWVTTGDGGEAPAASAAAGVSVGDTVTIEWDGSAMGIRSNVSNPSPAGSVVRRAVARAQGVADAAQRVADAVNQHFFADTSGIHVTEATQEEWETSHSGANVLINSIGQLFRDGLNNLLTLTTEGNARALTIWDGMGNAAENVRAIIGETITLGGSGESHVVIDANGFNYFSSENYRVAHMGSDIRLSPRGYGNGLFMRPTSEGGIGLSLSNQQGGSPEFPSGKAGNYSIAAGKSVSAVRMAVEGGQIVGLVPVDVGTDSTGSGSIAVGRALQALSDYQAVFGRMNVPDENGDYALIVGNGHTMTHEEEEEKAQEVGDGSFINIAHSNALTVDWLGNVWAAGKATLTDAIEAASAAISGLISAAKLTIIKDAADTGTDAIVVSDGTNDVFAVGWDGSLDVGGTVLVPESGKVGLTSDVPAGGTVDVSISFAKEHGAAPNVIVGLYSTSTAGAIGQVSAAVTSVTTTGFVARLFNAGTSARRPGLYWMTLG